ncbi:MAG: fumarylacetoacetate hydrolase family protein [Actinomycetes bacterium]
MEIVRYAERDTRAVHAGVRHEGRVRPVKGVATLADLLTLPLDALRARVEDAAGDAGRPVGEVLVLPPVDGLTEVWASGVTYERSMDARVEESQGQDAYTRVYGAERPELFVKCPAWRTVTDGEPIGVREDSSATVPEPELALVVNRQGEIVGYAACDDLTARDLEAENMLYLPQAKTYAGSFALGSGIRPAWEVPDPYALGISATVHRDGGVAWAAETSTAHLHRPYTDLVEHLVQPLDLPFGALLATGTGIVPELDFTLRPGDVVDIAIDAVGRVSNPVQRGREAFGWLTEALSDPFARESVRQEAGST